ncbi:MAG: DegT/DnrJ/EryC1/StrS family aminotransferase [Bryobacteraceae bacterium]
MTIHLTRPDIGDEEVSAAVEVMKGGWLIRGQQCKLLESEFSSYIGSRYAVATNGCTMALYLVLLKMNLTREDEVIVPSFTWSATASVVIQAGGTPVFADIDPNTWCLDPEDVKAKLSSKTRLVIPVHYAGRYASGFESFSVPVLYDSAHRIEEGDFRGRTSCYSFYAVKNMTTVRGGMVACDSEDEARWYAMACHGGVGRDTLARYSGGGDDASSFYYEVEVPAWNFDMTDVEAAIGRVQLRKLSQMNQARNRIVAAYNDAFGVQQGGNHLYPVLVQDRNAFLLAMKRAGIQCGIHYLPLHLMKGYARFYREPLPVTERVGAQCVSLPLYSRLTDEEIQYVVSCVKDSGLLTASRPLVSTVGAS